jgi:hypothetical protein
VVTSWQLASKVTQVTYTDASPEGEGSVERDGDVVVRENCGHDGAKADVHQACQNLDGLSRESQAEAFASDTGSCLSFEPPFYLDKCLVSIAMQEIQ